MVWVFAVILVIIGLAGVIMPAVPGTILIFGGLLFAAWTDGFVRVSVFTMAVLGVLTVAQLLCRHCRDDSGDETAGDDEAGHGRCSDRHDRRPVLRASWTDCWPVRRAVIGELTARSDLREAGRAGLAAWVGFLDWDCRQGRSGVLDGRYFPGCPVFCLVSIGSGMPKVRVAAFSVSLDGYGAGPRAECDNPLGLGFLPAFERGSSKRARFWSR